MATPNSARPATSMPVTAPARKAMESPSASDCVEACAVRTLARTDTSMPANPADPDKTAPIRKPIPTSQPNSPPTIKKITAPATAMVVYCRAR